MCIVYTIYYIFLVLFSQMGKTDLDYCLENRHMQRDCITAVPSLPYCSVLYGAIVFAILRFEY